MEDWARNLAADITEERRKKEKEREFFLEERKIKEARGRQLWEELKRSFQENIKLLNGELGEEFLIWGVMRSNELEIRKRNDPHPLRGQYDQSLDRISFESTSFFKPTVYTLQIMRSEVLLVSEEGWTCSPGEIAQNMLGGFCRAR